jgi:glucose/arabinose dehydrogenase
VTRFDLIQDRVQRRARDLRPGARLAPRQRVHGVLHRERHQRVPGGVEFDLVDPVPEAVEGRELGRMAVGVAPERERGGLAHRGAVGAHAVGGPAAALAREALAERAVDVEQVHVLERRRLVLDRVGRPVQIGRVEVLHTPYRTAMFRTVARWRWICGGLAALCIAVTACGGGGGHHGGGGSATVPTVNLASAFGGRTFSNPVKLVQHPTDDARWYVVEQGGLVRTFLSTNTSGATTAANVQSADGSFVSGGEQGLLGLAFDPNFSSSNEVYLTYTRNGTSVLARWISNSTGTTFTPDSPATVLAFGHPEHNHNGGDLAFGPDHFLYYSMGDGGGDNDPNDYGQNTNILLGKILRIDVNSTQGSDSYAVPSDNPFASGNAHCNGISTPASHRCPEIYAYGFRNPWRMSFDPPTGKLYVGDVGQVTQEEIDLVVKGGNYGWDCREGEVDHSSLSSANCTGVSFVAPEVVHGRSDARSITGGVVYHGTAVPGLQNFYVYGDYETGFFFAFDTSVPDAPAQRLSLPVTHVSAFGLGRDGEVYVVDYNNGVIKKIVGP